MDRRYAIGSVTAETITHAAWDIVEEWLTDACPVDEALDCAWETYDQDEPKFVEAEVRDAVDTMFDELAEALGTIILRKVRAAVDPATRDQMREAMEKRAAAYYGRTIPHLLAIARWGERDMPEDYLAAWARERELHTHTHHEDYLRERVVAQPELEEVPA